MDAKRKFTADPGSYFPDTKKGRQDEAETAEFGVVGVPNFENAIVLIAPVDFRKDTDPVKPDGATEDLEFKDDPEFNQNKRHSREHSVREEIEDNENRTHTGGESRAGECVSRVSAKQQLISPGTSSTMSSVNSCNLADCEALSSPVTITSLLEHPFTSGFWKVWQQDGILTQPIPFSRRYRARETWYQRFGSYPWLCESDELERYFCWPCLLYCDPQNIWSAVSTPALLSNPNFARLEEALVDHQTTTHHQKAESLYMKKSKITNAVHLELWKHLVQTVFSERKKNAEIKHSAEYESKIKSLMGYFFNKKITKQSASTLSKVILDIATRHMKNKITEEVQKAHYVALHIEDLSPVVADESWLVAIARYADQDGRIHDTVVDFIKASTTKANRNEHVAVEWIEDLLENYKPKENVIALSYSATLVSPKDILLFNNCLMKWCPQALFFHPPAESLYKSVFQAMSHSSFCRKFLQELHDMRKFLSKHTGLLSEVPTLFDKNFPRKIKSHLPALTAILNRIASLEEYKKERKEAKRYLQFLSKADSRLMITLLEVICSKVKKIAKAVEGPWVGVQWFKDLKYLAQERDKAIFNLRRIATRGFNEIVKDELLADKKWIFVDSNKKYQRHVSLICGYAAELLMQRFGSFDTFRSSRSDFVDCCIKDSNFICLQFGKLSNLSDSEMSRLGSFTKCRTHAELLGLITTEKRQQEFPILYKYLLFAHTFARDKSAFGNLLNSVYKLTENKSLSTLTKAYLDGYFWLAENVPAILEDPEFHQMARKACQAKVDEM